MHTIMVMQQLGNKDCFNA